MYIQNASRFVHTRRLARSVSLPRQTRLNRCLRSLREHKPPSNASQRPQVNLANETYHKLIKTLEIAYMSKITLSKFLNDMKAKYVLNGSFSWLSDKQRNTFSQILNKYKT